MTFKRLLPLLMVGVVGLSACDKPSAPTNETPPSTASETPATAQTVGSPFLDFQMNTTRFLVIGTIREDYPSLTPEQQACLDSTEGNVSYLSVLEPHFKSILTADELKEADAFFASEKGQQFTAIMLRTLNNLTDPNTVTMPTDEEKTLIMEASSQPFFAKVETHTSQMSDEEALAYLYSISDKEIERCQIQ